MYNSYTNFVEEICKSNNLSVFKSVAPYTDILEHVNKSQGDEYLQYIRDIPITTDEIVAFTKLNDSIGNPHLEKFDLFEASPSSLRYILHAHLILSHMKSLNMVNDIVEVGGGYGGLCLALHHFAEKYGLTINSYTIIDLPEISELQKLYLKAVNPSINAQFEVSSTFGENITKTNMFLISNYCFSEIDNSLQKKYIYNLFPKVSHGFMAWNYIPVYDFGFNTTQEKEYPLTGEHNKYVWF